MPRDLNNTLIYHITDISNLPSIIRQGGLYSDALMRANFPGHTNIGYDQIKARRLSEIIVPFGSNKFVGEYVPFYYCPRSPMLYTINQGNVTKPAGCQGDIVHLVSNVQIALGLGKEYAISDGNAGTYYATFYNDISALDLLDWNVLNSWSWGGEKRNKKQAEFLVADSFPWQSFSSIGCMNNVAMKKVEEILKNSAHKPHLSCNRNWYY